MSQVFPNTVQSVAKPPLLLILIHDDHTGWCKQFSEEGYTVIQTSYPPASKDAYVSALEDAKARIAEPTDVDWALITYGIKSSDLDVLLGESNTAPRRLQACVHFSPLTEDGSDLLFKYEDGKYVPTIVHIASAQEQLHASLNRLSDPSALGYTLPTSAFYPITVQAYPLVPKEPPFPFLSKAPALVTAGETSSVEPYVRSAIGLSYTRTLELLRRQLGPHYDLEKLWQMHTYFEFVERNAPKTMQTMVDVPYVNHIPTMTGGVGYDELARFYKYHFTGLNVTPPDTEMITVSRTVGADRIIDEMIFKCTHTTECDYFLPGIKPTGKHLEIALVGVVAFRGDKLTFEHIYWDQASALVQLGLLDPTKLPVTGVESIRKVIDPFGLPSNTLMARWKESEGLPITE